MEFRNAAAWAVVIATLAVALPARAQIEELDWVDDVRWHATLGTGVAVETGGAEKRDPALLYFGGDVKKAWRWWYGLTFAADVDLWTGIVDYPMVPYKVDGTTSFALGPPIFQMQILRARVRSEFGGVAGGYSTGTDLRLEASTLPTFSGTVDLNMEGRHLLSYMVTPLQLVVGRYDTGIQQRADDFNWEPYTAGSLSIGDRFIVSDWLQLHATVSVLKAYANEEVRFLVDLGAVLGILENSVQFGLDVAHDHWKTPEGFTENVATFTLSARLRI